MTALSLTKQSEFQWTWEGEMCVVLLPDKELQATADFWEKNYPLPGKSPFLLVAHCRVVSFVSVIHQK